VVTFRAVDESERLLAGVVLPADGAALGRGRSATATQVGPIALGLLG